MTRKTVKGWPFAIIVPVVLLLLRGDCLALDFTADFSDRQGDKVNTGKVIVGEPGYRLEMSEKNEKVVVIVNPTLGKTTVISPSLRQYFERDYGDLISVMNDPFQSYQYTKSFGEERPAGIENFGGFDCDLFQITVNNMLMMTEWVPRKLGFPIKIVGHGTPQRIIELSNIKEGPADKSLFEIPEGFSRWIDPTAQPPKLPEWAGRIPQAELLKPPFEHRMKSGDIVRVKIEPGKSIKIKSVAGDGVDAVARAIPFKGNLPLKDIDMISNFAQRGVICARIHETIAEADEVVIHVEKGDITVMCKFEEMSEKTVPSGQEFRFPIKGNENIEARFVNLDDGESSGKFFYFEGGKIMSVEMLGPASYRTVTLKNKGDVKKSAYVPIGDELVFLTENGTLLVKFGQFDSFEF